MTTRTPAPAAPASNDRVGDTNASGDLALGRHVAYPRHYDAALLFPIARAVGREPLGVRADALPFIGTDRWHAYELGWLDGRGKPRVATATLTVPADSPNLIESKSLKLYLNSFNATRFDSEASVRARMAADLSLVAGGAVTVAFDLPAIDTPHDATSIDAIEIDIDHYGPPHPDFITCDPTRIINESLSSDLLKSNCPVTGQPDWARVVIRYRGPSLDHASLLRYLVSFRDHSGFHEQCVEQIFCDLMQHAHPEQLSVEARYTRRGGLDINPWRATVGFPTPAAGRDLRQ